MSSDSQPIPIYAALVVPDADEVSVQIVPGAQNDVLIALTLSQFGNLARAMDVVGDRAILNLHLSRTKAQELAARIANLSASETEPRS